MLEKIVEGKEQVEQAVREGTAAAGESGIMYYPGREDWSTGDWIERHFGQEVPLQIKQVSTCPTCAARFIAEIAERSKSQGAPNLPGSQWTISRVLHNATRGSNTLKPDGTLPTRASDAVILQDQSWRTQPRDLSDRLRHELEIKESEEFVANLPFWQQGFFPTEGTSVPIEPPPWPFNTRTRLKPPSRGKVVIHRLPVPGSPGIPKQNPTTKKIPLDGKAVGLENAIYAFNFSDSEVQEITNEIGSPKALDYIKSFRCKKGETRNACRERMIRRGKNQFGG
jgi:hypothetical protein